MASKRAQPTLMWTGPELAGSGENASNPLAKVNNTDVRWQYFDLTSGDSKINDYFIDGALYSATSLIPVTGCRPMRRRIKPWINTWRNTTCKIRIGDPA